MAGLDVLELVLYRMELAGEELSVPDIQERCKAAGHKFSSKEIKDYYGRVLEKFETYRYAVEARKSVGE
jgi:predicted ABC-type ATPase